MQQSWERLVVVKAMIATSHHLCLNESKDYTYPLRQIADGYF